MSDRKGEIERALKEVRDLRQSTFGLEEYVKKVEPLLTVAACDLAPQYVGVWGMGGVGKSTLLKTLYARAKVQDHFRGVLFIWRTVGQSPDIPAIITLYRSLSEELCLKPEMNLNVKDYKDKLATKFKERRVFLVLDDVWEKQAFESLDLAKGEGSVTLMSTRNLPVLERASPEISQVHMTRLSKENSLRLFCVHAFRSSSNVPHELKTLAESMAEECKGLPLALKVIGGAMFGKYLREWAPLLKKLEKSRMHEGPVEDDLYKFLKARGWYLIITKVMLEQMLFLS
ncbi:unnamed protein product [Sphagnum compactum]